MTVTYKRLSQMASIGGETVYSQKHIESSNGQQKVKFSKLWRSLTTKLDYIRLAEN